MKELKMEIICPKCKNFDVDMLDTFGHRREQVSVYCRICGSNFIHIFKDVPKESYIPKSNPKSTINEWK